MTSITLNVREGWTIPEVLHKQRSPEDNENILEAGCRILTNSKSVSIGLSSKDLKEKIQNDMNQQIDQIKKEYVLKENNWLKKENEYKENLESYKISNEVIEKTSSTLRQSIETQISNATTAVRVANDNEFSKLKEQNDILSQKIRDEQVKSFKNDKDLTNLLKKEAEKERNKLLRANIEDRNSINEKTLEREKNFMKLLEDERERYHALQTRQVISSVKGSDNEKDFADILRNTFGQSRNWKNLPKTHNSGDHLIMWEGYKLMFENKIGLTESQLKSKNGLKKAYDDFQRNTDCDALIFVSENTNIPGHERPGNIDFDIIDNRPVIYISKFSEFPDKLSTMNGIIIPMIDVLLKIHKKTHNIDPSINNEELQQKLSHIYRLFNEFNQNLTTINTEISIFDRQQKRGIRGLKDTYRLVSASFKSILCIITENEYNDTLPPIDNDTLPPIDNDTLPPIDNDTLPPIDNDTWHPVDNNDKQMVKHNETYITHCGKGGNKGTFCNKTSFVKHKKNCVICSNSSDNNID